MSGLAIWMLVGLSAIGTDPPVMKKDTLYAQELLVIVQETQSVDAFMMALHLLQDLPLERHKIVPLVIRHAERLGIFTDHFSESGKELAQEVDEFLDKLAAKKPVKKGKVISGLKPAEKPAPVYRTPIVPPIRPDRPAPLCENPPTEAEVLRALRPVHGVPYLYEQHRGNIQITMERIVDKIDPPRFFPLVGPAQLHHCHWKCTVYYTATDHVNYPIPLRVSRPQVDVIYIDKDYLHLSAANCVGAVGVVY
jgi:hypothetical protein